MCTTTEVAFKITCVGDAGVGKTSLLRSLSSTFDPSENSLSTIGLDHAVRHILVEDQRVKLCIWDTAGQERFRSIVKLYQRQQSTSRGTPNHERESLTYTYTTDMLTIDHVITVN